MQGQKTKKQIVGMVGEDIAARFLRNNGFAIIERNYWKPYGEIDIIASKNEEVYFVEVKTVSRETSKYRQETYVSYETQQEKDEFRPEDNVHPAKLERLGRVVSAYIEEKNIESDWQFSVVSVLLDETSKEAHVRFITDVI